MTDAVQYQMHIRNLGQIKQRQNQYPTYGYNLRKDIIKSNKNEEIKELKETIQKNNKNINKVKQKNEIKNKPINYEDDEYLFDREVENMQKQMLNSLEKRNKELKNKLKEMKNNRDYYKPQKKHYK